MATIDLMPPLRMAAGELQIGGRTIVDLASSYGTPLYVTDEQRIRSNCRRLKAAFQKTYHKFKLNYAIKANNNLAILNIVRQEGAGADCSCAGGNRQRGQDRGAGGRRVSGRH
jgi:diaminopimelate decarboxylase